MSCKYQYLEMSSEFLLSLDVGLEIEEILESNHYSITSLSRAVNSRSRMNDFLIYEYPLYEKFPECTDADLTKYENKHCLTDPYKIHPNPNSFNCTITSNTNLECKDLENDSDFNCTIPKDTQYPCNMEGSINNCTLLYEIKSNCNIDKKSDKCTVL